VEQHSLCLLNCVNTFGFADSNFIIFLCSHCPYQIQGRNESSMGHNYESHSDTCFDMGMEDS